MRSFLPDIYNSAANMQEPHLSARQQSPSFSNYIQPVFDLKDRSMFIDPATYVDPMRKDETTRQDSTDMTNNSEISHQGGDCTISDDEDQLKEKGYQRHDMFKNISGELNPPLLLNKESTMEDSFRQCTSPVTASVPSSEINDWINEGIQNTGYRLPKPKRARNVAMHTTYNRNLKLNSRTVGKTEPHSVQPQSPTNFYSSRNLLPERDSGAVTQQEMVGDHKRYMSSDIFALKKIQAEQSRHDLLLQVGKTTSRQNMHKRKERLLVQSLDLSQMVESVKRMDRNSRFGRTPNMLQSHAVFKPPKISTSMQDKHSSMVQIYDLNKKKKNFLIAPLAQPMKQPLGVAGFSESVCETLIGQMPKGERQVQAETMKTFSPMKNLSTTRNKNYQDDKASTDMKIIHVHSRSSLPPDTSMSRQKALHTKSNHLSEFGQISQSDPSSPALKTKGSTSRLRKNQDVNKMPPMRLERILNADGKEDAIWPVNAAGELKPVTFTRTNLRDKNESPLMFQGYQTMQLAGTLSGNVSQSLLHNTSNLKQNNSIAADLAANIENRVTTAAKRDFNESQFAVEAPPARISQNSVTTELYSQFEMEVLRKKIEKRITMQKQSDREYEMYQKQFKPEIEPAKKGPFRLNMETQSRKTVMKILQDNRQKLSVTRQEIMETMKQQRGQRINTEALSSFNEGASVNLSCTVFQAENNHTNQSIDTSSVKKIYKHIKTNQTEDVVLQSVVFDRLASGMPAKLPRGDIMSQMSQMKDEVSHGLYHQKLIKNVPIQIEKLESITNTQQTSIETEGQAIPDFQPKNNKNQTQSERDRAAVGRLLQYQVDQIEQEALLKESDEEELHGLLKYKLSKYIKIQGAHQPKIADMYHYEPKAVKMNVEQEEDKQQRKFHAAANKFMNMKEGRLMTRRSMQDLLAELEKQENIMVACKKPMYGEISYDRAANEMFDVEPGVDIDSESHKKRKARALLYKYESDEASAAAENDELQAKIQTFVNSLLSDANYSNESHFAYDVDPSREPKSAYFKPRSNNRLTMMSPLLRLPQPSLIASVSQFDHMSGHGSIGGSPVKVSRQKRHESLISNQRESVQKQSRPRKVDISSIMRQSNLRGSIKEMERFPLKNMSADTTDDIINKDQIAHQIYELLDFYKVYKSSISQVYLERFNQDYRLGYLLECISCMDPILPLLDKVQPDGTLYLKEYGLKEGQTRGLAMACLMNPLLFQRIYIDNCGLSEFDTATIMAGLTELNQVRSLVLRRTTISEQSIPNMSQLMVKIFPNNLNILKIEKCKISKEATFDLISALKERNYVRVLSLVSVSFDAESIEVFCELLEKKNSIEELDLSDNHLDPKLFHQILSSLSKCRAIKSLNLSWNLLLEKAKPPQIGTYCKEENIVYGRADEPIEFPPTPPSEKADATGEEGEEGRADVQSAANLLESGRQTPGSASQSSRPPRLNLEQINQTKRGSIQAQDKQSISPERRSPQLNPSSLESGLNLNQADANLRATALSKFQTTMSKIEEESKVDPQEELVCEKLEDLIKSSTLQHLDFSDCGLTENMIMRVIRAISESSSILSAHLSGNPGLKDQVTTEIQDYLKATYEEPILKSTFKPLIRMYDNKHGLKPTSQGMHLPNTVRDSMLTNIKEHEHSVSSGSLYDYSEKHVVHPEKLKEQIAYKALMREKEPLLPIDDSKMSRDHKRHFMISRQLGNDLLTPGVSEWQLMKDNAQECWVCDRKQFVFFFWSPEFASQSQYTASWLSEGDKNKILEMVHEDREKSNLRTARRLKIDEGLKSPRNPFEIEEKSVSQSIESSDRNFESISQNSESLASQRSEVNDFFESPKVKQKPKHPYFQEPMIYGSFNNWQSQPMIRVSHLARNLDKSPAPDFLQQCKDLNKCRPKITDISEMKTNEREFYQKHVEKFWESYENPTVWGPIISEFMKAKFKQTRIIGRENFEVLHPKKLYVTAAYMDMGKNNYIVTMGSKTFFHETKVSFRREPLPQHSKFRGDAIIKERMADVFKFWVKDTPDLIKKVYDLDCQYNKILSIIKQPLQQQDMRDFILPHYSFIKDVFLTLSLNSGNFPYVLREDFTRFCDKTLQIMGGDLNQSRVSTIISCVKGKAGGKDLDKVKLYKQGAWDLSRAEFFEALVRVAIAKFKEMAPNPAVVSVQDALERLVVECLKPNFVPAPWQVFRDEELWTQKPNLVFADNEDGLKKLFKMYAKPGLNKIPFQTAIELFTNDCTIKLDKFDTIYCYGMSLSTCTDLMKLTQNKLMNMGYEEFLEFIARVADVHFQGSEFESHPLWEKIMLILDELFQLVEDCNQPISPEWTTVSYNDDEFKSSGVGLLKRPNIK